MNSDCARWISIADREAIGDAVLDDDARFRRDHQVTCAACRHEAASYDNLQKSPIELPVESVEVDAVLHRFSEQRIAVVAKRSRSRIVQLAGALAMAAGIALIWKVVGRNVATVHDEASGVRVVVASGALHASAGALSEGTQIARGTAIETSDATACIGIDPGVRVCFAPRSRAKLVGTTMSDRRIELLAGKAAMSLEPQPTGSGFTISTRAGTASAIGTEYEVEVGDTVTVAVLKGVVLVVGRDGKEMQLTAGRRIMLDPSEVTDHLPTEGPTVADEPSGSPASSHPSRAAPSQPADLLGQAREERARAHFAQAAELYRRLEATSPDSAEAHVALVALGDLQLTHLADAAGALRSFDAYLRGGGGLSQEAWYGKIRALRELGRTSDERQAIERFLVAYPSAVQASALKSRLAELR